MADKVFYIKSSTGKYNYVQEAHCRHCLHYGAKRVRGVRGAVSASFCFLFHKFTNKDSMACNSFECNSRFVIANHYVQLNIFDYATESLYEVPTVRDQASS